MDSPSRESPRLEGSGFRGYDLQLDGRAREFELRREFAGDPLLDPLVDERVVDLETRYGLDLQALDNEVQNPLNLWAGHARSQSNQVGPPDLPSRIASESRQR